MTPLTPRRDHGHPSWLSAALRPGNPIVLMATIAATELAMLNVVSWARAQGSLAGLALAVAWPWLAAVALPLLWSARPRVPRLAIATRPRVAAAVALAAAVVLLGNLVAVAG